MAERVKEQCSTLKGGSLLERLNAPPQFLPSLRALQDEVTRIADLVGEMERFEGDKTRGQARKLLNLILNF
jgi:hypothetical protein